MAISALTVFEVRLTGSDTNGGGFVTGASGTDWSQQDTAQYSVTDGVTAGTTTITSATANFGTDVVGNIMYVQGGTGSVVAGWYQIISRTNATTVVVDRSTGLTAGTAVTLIIGGALLSPGQAALAAQGVGGTTIYIKYNASPYVITSASTNIAQGCVLGATNQIWAGYDSVRALYQFPSNRPTLQLNSGVSTATIITGTNNASYIQSMILDGNNQTSARCGLNTGEWFNVKATGATISAAAALAQNSTTGKAIYCEVTGNSSTYGMNCQTNLFCSIHNNTFISGGAGMQAGAAFGCLSYSNTGTSNDGYGAVVGTNCIAYGNTRHGFNPANSGLEFVNCISENNGGYGWSGGTNYETLINCADYNNTSGRKNPATGRFIGDINSITGTGSFFVNAAGGDFKLNNTAGAGAALRATGFPITTVEGLSDYGDIGAIQHQDTGGGGSTGISRARGASGF